MLSKLKQLTDKKDRVKLVLFFLIILTSTVIEMVGIGSIPIFAAAIVNPESVIKHIPKIFDFDFVYELDKKKLALYSAIFLIAIFALKNSFLIFVNYFQGKLMQQIRTKITNNLFSFYMHTKYEFHLTRNPSGLIRNVVAELSRCVGYIMYSITLFKETLMMFMIFGLVVAVDPIVSLVTFGVLGIFSILFFLLSKKGVKKRGQIYSDYSEKLIKTLNHGLGSIKDTKILNKENYIINIFKSIVNKIEHTQFLQNFIQTLPRIFLEFIAVMAVAIISILFVLLDRSFQNFIPLMSLITISAIRLIPSFNTVSVAISIRRYHKPAFELIAKELSIMKSMSISKNSIPLDTKEKRTNMFKKILEVKGLNYYYPNTNKKVIENVSFKINYGEIIAIVGASGAGKSTLIDLIVGLLEPSSGKILIDGISIKESAKNWQKQIGYVPQEIYLLDDTIKANIAFGIPENEFKKDYLSEAIRLAQLDEFIDTLPNKENTIVGDRGIRLSGGQRQRIGIARSLYFKPKVLIFDEPTNALDIENEKKIMKHLYSLGGNMTIIIISHRYTTLDGCKKILNIKNGKVDEVLDYKEFFQKKYLN